ncbi:MAG: calcium-binding protein [Methylobacter sp.]|nr:calcium-binding protein [Methylobacter sp.]
MNKILTTGTDNLTGTSGADIFTATYNDSPTGFTFGISDVLNGGAGVDTLDIDTNHIDAITPIDDYWTGTSNIEKVVVHSGTGAQTITTGAAFEAAFAAAGVNLSTTSDAGAITLAMDSFTGAAAITMLSTDGAQTVSSGSGVTTVSATSTAGAQTITGPGLTKVVATSTHGAQTISGDNLHSVTAVSEDGAQTITGVNLVNVVAHTTGMQTITTGIGANVITASSTAPENIIATKAGNDIISATDSTGSYTIDAGNGNDKVNGGMGNDRLLGGAGNDKVNGAAGDDILNGGAGNDILSGGAGNDKITGGAGHDTFVLDSNVGVDKINGFSVADDTIGINHLVFNSLSTITADNFVIGTAAADANDYLVYNSNNGHLQYDVDGNGAGAAVDIAILGAHLGLTSLDFSVM